MRITCEDIAEDDGFYYVVIVAEQGEMELTEDEIAFGPYLLHNGHPLYKDMLSLKRRDLEQLLISLSEEQTEELIKRKNQLNDEIAQISRVIEQLG